MKANEYKELGRNGEYTLLYFASRTFAYVWVWKPSMLFGRLIWEQGHYFETEAQALEFMHPNDLEAA